MADELKMTTEEALNLKKKLTEVFEVHVSRAKANYSDAGIAAARTADSLIKLDEHAIKMRMAVK